MEVASAKTRILPPHVDIVCPTCKAPSTQSLVPGRTWQGFRCSCGNVFQSHLCWVRAKNSRGSRADNRPWYSLEFPQSVGSRSFSVRVINPDGSEQLVQFEHANWSDFELRSGDLVAFTNDAMGLRVAQNLTVNVCHTVMRPSDRSGCALAMITVVMIGVGWIALLARSL